MEKRTLLAIVLSLGVILIYQLVFQPAQKRTDNITANTTTAVTGAKAPSVATTTPAATPVASQQPKQNVVKEQEVLVDTPLYRAVFSTRGASVKSLTMKKYSAKMGDPEHPVEMVHVNNSSHLPLALAFVESSVNMPQDIAFSSSTKEIKIEKRDKGDKHLVFTATQGKMKVEKTFIFNADGYDIKVNVKITNLAEIALSQNPVLFWYANKDFNGKAESKERVGPLYYLVKDVKRPDDKDFASGKLDGPDISWAGMESKYFLAAMVPPQPLTASVSMGKDLTDTSYMALFGGKMMVPPHQTASTIFSLFIGPKEYDALSKQNMKLEDAIDFGFFRWLSVPILIFMQSLYKYAPNYGVGIIVIALLVKIIFWPLGTISYRSMKKMQQLQPRLKEIQEKYKDDRQKMGQETMALYKAHKVNPMSGCLPMLVQIPVFIALFNALQYAIELRHAHFCLWITDLSAADPYYVTPILMGATMFIQQKMSPPPPDPTQAKVMMFLPLIFTVFFLNFSSGLVIYWLLSNVLSIGQQLYINKKLS